MLNSCNLYSYVDQTAHAKIKLEELWRALAARLEPVEGLVEPVEDLVEPVTVMS